MKTSELKKLISSIFKKNGLSQIHSDISASALINAELVGAYGHGLSRLKMYCERITKKVINQFHTLTRITVLVLLRPI